MLYALEYLPEVKADLLALPPQDRDEFWRIVEGLRRAPFAPGPGYVVREVHDKDPRLEGSWTAHFDQDRLRLLYFIDGRQLVLVGVGERPGFYRRLNRLRQTNLR